MSMDRLKCINKCMLKMTMCVKIILEVMVESLKSQRIKTFELL